MNKRTLQEKQVLDYLNALDRGDVATMLVILQDAETDVELSQMLLETHRAMGEAGVRPTAQLTVSVPKRKTGRRVVLPRQRELLSRLAVTVLVFLDVALIALVFAGRSATLTRVQDDTNSLDSLAIITPDNAPELVELAEFGKGTIEDLSWSRDGRTLAVATSSGVWLHDVDAPNTPRRLNNQAMRATTLSFSPDSGVLAVGIGTYIEFWDAAANTLLDTWDTSLERVDMAVFSPNGTLLAAADTARVQVWNIETKAIIDTTVFSDAVVADLAFSPRSNQLAIATRGGPFGERNAAFLWNVGSFARPERVLEGTFLNTSAVGFADEGVLLAYAGGGAVQMWDLDTGELHERIGSGFAIEDIAFSLNGNRFALAAYQVLHLRNLDAEEAVNLRTGEAVAALLAFSPDATRLASVSQSGRIQVWNTDTHELLATFGDYSGIDFVSVLDLVFNPSSTQIAAASLSGTIQVWDIRSAEPVLYVDGTGQASQIAFSPDGSSLASTGSDPTVVVRRIDTGEVIQAIPLLGLRSLDLVIAPDNTVVVTNGATVSRWRERPGERPGDNWSVVDAYPPYPSIVTAVLDTNGQSLATMVNEGDRPEIHLWNQTRPDQIGVISAFPDAEVTQAVFHPLEDALAVATVPRDTDTREATVTFWDVSTGRKRREFITQSDYVIAMAYSPDGALLVLADVQGILHVLDVAQEHEIATFHPDSPVVRLVFDTSGTLLGTGDQTGQVQVWGIPQ